MTRDKNHVVQNPELDPPNFNAFDSNPSLCKLALA